MKRGEPPKRKTPLTRGSKPIKRTALKRVTTPIRRGKRPNPVGRRGKAHREAMVDLRIACFARDGYRCQAVGKLPGECAGPLDPHHRLPRGRGGSDRLDNLVSVCRFHHDAIDAYPVEAKRLGLLR